MKTLITFAIALVFALPTFAQTEGDSQPASSNARGAQYPRLHSDRSVTFQIKAPDARRVEIAGGDGLGKGPFAMTKGDDGIWSVTIPPAVPGFHYYWFLLDGVQVNDPGNKTYFGYSRETGGIEIPEAGVDFYDLKDVPHGQERSIFYHSKVTESWRHSIVYTPPDYDQHSEARYPVLILQHGAGEDDTGWTRQGHINFILDNLIAEGKAKPMIVVMDTGYARKARGDAPSSAFEEVVIEDVIPLIDSTFRTIPDREHRAIAGLSMGGMQAMSIGLQHLDAFAFVGSFSGPIRGSGRGGFDAKTAYNGVFADPNAFNSKVKLLWMGAGTAEAQFHDTIKSAADSIRAAGIKIEFYESPGTAHEWLTWRRDAHEFLPKLFQ